MTSPKPLTNHGKQRAMWDVFLLVKGSTEDCRSTGEGE
jgi:hypothetical protein